jgi:hypothetical protein
MISSAYLRSRATRPALLQLFSNTQWSLSLSACVAQAGDLHASCRNEALESFSAWTATRHRQHLRNGPVDLAEARQALGFRLYKYLRHAGFILRRFAQVFHERHRTLSASAERLGRARIGDAFRTERRPSKSRGVRGPSKLRDTDVNFFYEPFSVPVP